MREWLNRLLDMFRRDRLDAELAEELRHHRALAARDGGAVDSDLRTREAARERCRGPGSTSWARISTTRCAASVARPALRSPSS